MREMLRQTKLCTAVALIVALIGCDRGNEQLPTGLQNLFEADRHEQKPASEVEPWEKALTIRDFQFPRDHAAHEDFRIEWWYYTGNVIAEDGRKFGYQLTFFRTGTNWQLDNPSRWAVRDLYTAHFAISDQKTKSHVSFQRNNRRGVGWAGAAVDRYEVWNGDWRVWMDGERQRLVAGQDGYAIDLVLEPAKPVVLQGEKGLSRKGATPGNSSYYYSFTRLTTSGKLRINGEIYDVEGHSWMDHEFSSSLLEENQSGWDWFSIQLTSNQELMLYRMRNRDGSADRFSSGTFVDKDGSVRHLASEDFILTPIENWTSPHTDAEYPVRWRVEIPMLKMQLQIEATFSDQEMVTQRTTGIAYWEGSVSVEGRIGGSKVLGDGYLEMTGYSGRSLGELFRTNDQ
jgi:predicted secreted hydrolase